MSIKVDDELKAVLERVQQGSRLSKSERLRALEELEFFNTLSAPQLAKLLGVSVRTVRSDRAELRRRYQDAIKDLNLIGELHRQFQITLGRIDHAIEQGDYKRVRALGQRWAVCEGFIKIAIPYQIDELAGLVDKARDRLNGSYDGNGNSAKS